MIITAFFAYVSVIMDSLQQSADTSTLGFRGAGISLIVVTALFVAVRLANSFTVGNRRLLLDDSEE